MSTSFLSSSLLHPGSGVDDDMVNGDEPKHVTIAEDDLVHQPATTVVVDNQLLLWCGVAGVAVAAQLEFHLQLCHASVSLPELE